jgi:hypothetical protein
MKKLIPKLFFFGTVLTTLFTNPHLSLAQDNDPDSRIRPEAFKQIKALVQEKESRTPAQKKIDSRLLYTIKMNRGERIAEDIPTLETGLKTDERGFIDVEIRAHVTSELIDELKRIKAEILVSLPEYKSITARLPIDTIESLASREEVIFIMPKPEPMTSHRPEISLINALTGHISAFEDIVKLKRHSSFKERAQRVREFISSKLESDTQPETGSVNSQGDTTHGANTFRSTTGFNGSGIRIGVLSDGINSVAARQATGDLPVINVLTGQFGNGDEGTAMLEIVHDVAPGAQLYFATAFNGSASFAQNIRNLRAVGCTIIIDDVNYFNETPFQNGQAASVISNTNGGVVVQAVNDVTVGSQAGALFFSSAGNSGNKNDGTAGAWEGDFIDAGPAGGVLSGRGNLHNFGGTVVDTITSSPNPPAPVTLKWSDPLGASGNDYDFFVLNNAGTLILAAANNFQTGTQDPYEEASSSTNIVGNIIAIVKFSGTGRFLHLNTNRGRLGISTSGTVYGHNAGLNTVSLAATPSGPDNRGVFGPYPNLFNAGNKVELFSSDGPRRIFYNADSTQITPGNVSSTGGSLLQKPDITAADGVSTTSPGFSSFFGTSAASPHAGALAALLRSACPASTNAQLVSAMKSTAIDIEAIGTDRDSGAGIFMPIPARNALCSSSCTSTPISIGQTVNGTLQSGDCLYTDNSFYDAYTFNATAGQQVFFTMNSAQFNTFLLLYQGSYPGGSFIIGDDNGGGGTNSRIPATSGFFTIPASGTYTILANSLSLGETGSYSLTLGSNVSPSPRRRFDFDGDGKADISVFRPSLGDWYRLNSLNNTFFAMHFGLNGDRPVPADFDNDGKTDIAVFRPSNGTWYWLNSSTGAFSGIAFGLNGDLPVPADFDGDGRADVCVYRPSAGIWYRLNSSTGQFIAQNFGVSTDRPAVADFDGDGKADICVFRRSNGDWYRLNSSNGQFFAIHFGLNGDKPTPADYDGDGKADVSVFRPSVGDWYRLNSSTGAFFGFHFGVNGDLAAPADFDGDAKADIVVFRPSSGTWYLQKSTAGFSAQMFGLNGDLPSPNSFVY